MALDYILPGSRMNVYWELDGCSVFLTIRKGLWRVLGAWILLRYGLHWPVAAVWLYNVNSNKSEKADERRAQRRPTLIVWCKLLDLLIILLRSISHSIKYFLPISASFSSDRGCRKSILCLDLRRTIISAGVGRLAPPNIESGPYYITQTP